MASRAAKPLIADVTTVQTASRDVNHDGNAMSLYEVEQLKGGRSRNHAQRRRL